MQHNQPLHTNDFQRIAQEIKEGRGVITPMAIATRWGIHESLAATLINKHTK